MGCFDKTCVLTNTAISRGDSCFIIIFWKELKDIFFKNNKDRDLTYKFLQYLSEKVYEIESFSETRAEREDSQFLKFQEHSMDFYNKILKSYKVYYGPYNDYGFIEGAKKDAEDEYEDFGLDLIMHTFAIEHLLGKNIKTILNDVETDKILYPASFLFDFITTCYSYRINLFWKWLLGEQHDWIDEMKNQLKFLKETETFLKQKIKKYKSYQ